MSQKFPPPGSPVFMVKRIGTSEYLASETPTFSHLPADGLYFFNTLDAEQAIARVWPTVNARSAAQVFIVRVA